VHGLYKKGNTVINTINEAKAAFFKLMTANIQHSMLLFSHPEIHPNLLHNGLPIISSAPFLQAAHDQLNN
jgi:hypothetical protein